MNQKIVYETSDANEVNQLWNSKEWSKPHWSETKGKYILVRKVSSLK